MMAGFDRLRWSGIRSSLRPERLGIRAGLLLMAILVSACNPALERQYYKEGIGTSVANPNIEAVTELQNVYLSELCRQASASTSSAGCEPAGISSAWGLVVQAGMNDIDARCDAYLAWLDDKRRSYGPIVSEINSLNTAAQAIMRVTGVGADPITLVGIAFGLASDTFTNIRSRLLVEVDHSTVQSIVLSRQKTYRDGLGLINNRAAAIYALRSYLRLCMPMTIEMQINTTVAIFEQTGSAGLDQKERRPLIDPRTVGGVALRATQSLTKPIRIAASPLPPDAALLFISPANITIPFYKNLQAALCVPDSEIGEAGPFTKGGIQIFKASFRGATKGDKLDNNEIQEIMGQGKCVLGRGLNYFEKRTFDSPDLGTAPLMQLVNALNAAQPERPLSCNIMTIGDARDKIAAVRALPSIKAKLKLSLPSNFSNQVTPDLFSALPRPTNEICK